MPSVQESLLDEMARIGCDRHDGRRDAARLDGRAIAMRASTAINAVGTREQRVDVQLGNLRQFGHDVRDAQQYLDHRPAIDGRAIAEGRQQLRNPRPVDQPFGQNRCQRRQRDGAVAQDLDHRAAGAKDDGRTEDRVARHADQKLARAFGRGHGRNRHAMDFRLRRGGPRLFDDLLERGPDVRRAHQVGLHPADVRLVGDVW